MFVFFLVGENPQHPKPQALGCLGCATCREVRAFSDLVIGGNAPMCRLLKRFIRVKPWVPCRSEDSSR